MTAVNVGDLRGGHRPADPAARAAPGHLPGLGRLRLHRSPDRLGPRETCPDRRSRQTDRRHEGVRGAAQAVGGRAHPELADALQVSVPGLRDAARYERGDDPVVDDHADEPPPGPATGTRPALNIPDASWTSHPRSASRLAFDRTPSTFAGVGSSPNTTAIPWPSPAPDPAGRPPAPRPSCPTDTGADGRDDRPHCRTRARGNRTTRRAS